MYRNRGIARRLYAWLFEPQQDRQVVGVAAVVTEAAVGALGLAAEVALVVFQKVVGGIDKEFYRSVLEAFGEVALIKIRPDAAVFIGTLRV